MREPAATVNVGAFKSPVSCPDSNSLTCELATILPSSSPAMVTMAALIFAAMCAPFSMLRSPEI